MQYFGRATIVVNGKALDSLPGAKLELGGVIRKAVTTDSRTGYVEELAPGRVECEVAVSKETDFAGLRDLVDATVLFRTDVGKNFVVRDAFTEDGIKAEGKDGKMSLKLTGQAAEEA